MKLIPKSIADKMPPAWAGKIVDMMIHNGHVFVACEFAVFCQYDARGPFQPLGFVKEAPK